MRRRLSVVPARSRKCAEIHLLSDSRSIFGLTTGRNGVLHRLPGRPFRLCSNEHRKPSIGDTGCRSGTVEKFWPTSW